MHVGKADTSGKNTFTEAAAGRVAGILRAPCAP